MKKKLTNIELINKIEECCIESKTPYVDFYEPGMKSILTNILSMIKKHKRKTRQPQ
jgi:hypothetical protein